VAKTIKTALQAANVEAGSWRVAGSAGLYLTVSETGTRSWVYRYRIGDKRRYMGLGSLDRLSLSDARKKVRELAAQRDEGRDPIEARRKEREANLAEGRRRAPVSFRQATEAYFKDHAPSWRHRYSASTWLNPIAKYAFPVIGGMPLDDIRVEHVVATLRAAVANKAPVAGQKVRGRIEAILNAAIAKGERDATRGNPADGKLIAAILPSKRKASDVRHFRRLPLDDTPAVFRELLSRSETNTAFAAWVFMILTAMRPSEALGAQWGEIDLERAGGPMWAIPGGRMKGAREHIVPLSSLAVKILKRQATIRIGKVVFPGRGASPYAYSAFASAPARAGLDAGSPHGWRSVFRDACGDRLRVDRDLAEAALSHTLGAVEGAYRRETAIEARRPVMEAYAKWLEGEPSDNVVAFLARA
jgi:integrase